MAPTLAELRARTGAKPRPKATRRVTLVEGQHLLDESRRLHEELVDLMASMAGAVDDPERSGPPRKAGAKSDPRIAEIEDAQKSLLRRLAEHQGEIGLVGLDGGAWQRWKDLHPPREDNRADLRLTGGLCDSSDLFGELGTFVETWNGEKVVEGDWDGWLAESITYADRRDLVTAVVEMHEESVARSPFFTSVSSGTPSSATESDSPAN